MENNELKLAFYTYFYGCNNNPAYKIPQIPSLKYDCYYFTNNPDLYVTIKKTSKWIAIFDDKPISTDPIISCMTGKHIKTCPHLYSPINKYDYLCYLDSKLDKVSEQFVEGYIKKYFIENEYALLLRKHWYINGSVYNEFNESMGQNRYFVEREKYKSYIERQVKNGLSENTTTHSACGFLIRNMKHKNMNELNETWYTHIQECGIQDQISFFFVKQLYENIILPFTNIPFV
jgi:hypothetical protein